MLRAFIALAVAGLASAACAEAPSPRLKSITVEQAPIFNACQGFLIGNGLSPATCAPQIRDNQIAPDAAIDADKVVLPPIAEGQSRTSLRALLGDTVQGLTFGLVDDPGCSIDQRPRLQAAIDAGASRRIVLPKGTFCVKSVNGTLRMSAPNTQLSGQGRATLIKWAAPAGSRIAPLIDVQPEAVNSSITDLGFDHGADTGNYTDSRYFGTDPWGGIMVAIQADNFVGERLFGRAGFDNCFGIGAFDFAQGHAARGLPRRVTLNAIHTEACGSGNHSAEQGGPGKIGAGIDNGSGSNVTISNAVDYFSYGSFIADIGAGGYASWSNITSYYSRKDLRDAPALYVGDANNSFANLTIIEPAGKGIWSDYHATGSQFSNVNVKAAKDNCLWIKGPGSWSNVTCSDPSYNAATPKPAIVIDSTGGTIDALSMTGLNITTALSTPSVSIASAGTNNVIGRIDALRLPGVNAATAIDPALSGLQIVTQTAKGMGLGKSTAGFAYDFSGATRVQASGAPAAIGTCAIGDGCDATSFRLESASGGNVIGTGYDATLGWVAQAVRRWVMPLPYALNPSGGTVSAGKTNAALGDTNGFFAISKVAGQPTGVPADVPAGMVAMRYDATGHKLWIYDGGWKSATFN